MEAWFALRPREGAGTTWVLGCLPGVSRTPRSPALATESLSQPPPLESRGLGLGGGIWKNHPDCIAVGEATWSSRFPRAASPRGSLD